MARRTPPTRVPSESVPKRAAPGGRRKWRSEEEGGGGGEEKEVEGDRAPADSSVPTLLIDLTSLLLQLRRRVCFPGGEEVMLSK